MIEVKSINKNTFLVRDSEDGQTIEVTEAMRKRAWAMHTMLSIRIFETVAILRTIKEERLYLAMHYESFAEYARNINMSRTQAFIYQTIGEKFEKFLPKITAQDQDVQTLNVTFENNNETGEAIEELGISRLYEIARLDASDVAELFESGAVTNENGDRLTLEEIRAMSVRDTEKSLAAYRKKATRRIAILEEQTKTAKSEKKRLEEDVARLKKKNEELRALERKYGAGASTIEGKNRNLNFAMDCVDTCRQYIVKTRLQEDDPIHLHEKCAAVIRKLDQANKEMIQQYPFLLELG